MNGRGVALAIVVFAAGMILGFGVWWSLILAVAWSWPLLIGLFVVESVLRRVELRRRRRRR